MSGLGLAQQPVLALVVSIVDAARPSKTARVLLGPGPHKGQLKGYFAPPKIHAASFLASASLS